MRHGGRKGRWPYARDDGRCSGAAAATHARSRAGGRSREAASAGDAGCADISSETMLK